MTNISIITPSYNQGKFIERTLKSTLEQNIAQLQYIVIDGESTDETLSILEKYHTKIELISEKDTGQANAINKGFKKAQGEIIGWLNSDDIYFSGTIEYVLDFFKNNPTVDVLYGNADHIDEKDIFISHYPTKKWSLKQLKSTCFICQPAVFFKQSLFDKFGYLNEDLNFCMDYEFWLRLAVNGAKFQHTTKILAASRLHASCKSIAQSTKAHAEQIQMISEYRKKIPFQLILSYIFSQQKTPSYTKAISETANLAVKYNGVFHTLISLVSLFTCFFFRKIYRAVTHH